MKKTSFLPILALVIAVAASAFTNKHSLVSKTTETFVYTGSTAADQDDPNQYVLLSTNPSVSCGGSPQVICRIEAQPDGSGMHPDFSNGDPLNNPDQFEIVSKRALGQ